MNKFWHFFRTSIVASVFGFMLIVCASLVKKIFSICIWVLSFFLAMFIVGIVISYIFGDNADFVFSWKNITSLKPKFMTKEFHHKQKDGENNIEVDNQEDKPEDKESPFNNTDTHGDNINNDSNSSKYVNHTSFNKLLKEILEMQDYICVSILIDEILRLSINGANFESELESLKLHFNNHPEHQIHSINFHSISSSDHLIEIIDSIDKTNLNGKAYVTILDHITQLFRENFGIRPTKKQKAERNDCLKNIKQLISESSYHKVIKIVDKMDEEFKQEFSTVIAEVKKITYLIDTLNDVSHINKKKYLSLTHTNAEYQSLKHV